MNTKKNKLILIAGAGFLLVLILAAALVVVVDLEKHRGRIETAASKALGMDFRVKGHMAFSLIPAIGVKMDDITLARGKKPVLSARGLRVGIEILPLFKKEVRADTLEFIKPVISIERDSGGRFNFEQHGGKKAEEGKFAMERFGLNKLIISDGVLSYNDRKTGKKWEVADIEMILKDLVLNTEKGAESLKSISFTGQIAAETVKADKLVAANIRGKLEGKEGMVSIDPLTMNMFGGKGTAGIRMNRASAVPAYEVDFRLSGFRIEEFLEAVSRKHLLQGEMDFSLKLSAQGMNFRNIKQNMHGDISLRGEDLLLYNLDLDRLLAKYEESQNFNLVDVGAFIFAGPVGTALSKGYDFTDIYQETRNGERGAVRRIVSVWKVKNGIAEADDVAFATRRNRIAVKGRSNFVSERFDNITVALLDKRGCAKYRQKITGPFRNPQIGKTNMLMSLVGPVLKLLEQTKDIVGAGGTCEVFYSGSVRHPA